MKKLARRIPPLLAATSLCLACEKPGDDRVKELVISQVDTLVSLDSELLASPNDVAVDAGGRVYVLDGQLASVLVISGPADTPFSLGGEGSGPGEFNRPTALAVGADSIRVFDGGNGRVQVLNSDGTYVRSYPIPAEYVGGANLHPSGYLAVPTEGFRQDALALTFQSDGQPSQAFGTLVTPSHEIWDMAAIRGEIMAGEVPRQLRNWTLPTVDADGSLWLILNAEGIVQRYDARGSILWSLPLEVPEMSSIKERFFSRNRELQAPGFVPLTYVADAARLDDEIWLLLNVPDEEPGVVLVVGDDGALRRRLTFPNVYGADALAVDPGSRTIYLVVPSEASLLAAHLPSQR